ncbi:MAG: FadR family transcriptional regulator [Desulfohalobiaceae bacterium]|nr:FadR family transcriptional regulator [Desulfohalobiaceae bacterium]
MFQKARPIRTFEIVSEQIQQAIFSGKLKPGEKLPAERELVKEFDISRRTLREALRVLELKGLIEIKTGLKGGAVVRDLNTEQMSDSLATLIRYEKASLFHLTEFRMDLEGTVAGRAAEKATEQDVQGLKDLLAEAEDLLTARPHFNWKTFMDVDRRTHQSVATIAGNPIHEFVLHSIHENIHRYYENFLPSDKGVSQQNYEDLISLVKAIERKRAEQAEKAARKHIENGWKFMQQRRIEIDPRGAVE